MIQGPQQVRAGQSSEVGNGHSDTYGFSIGMALYIAPETIQERGSATVPQSLSTGTLTMLIDLQSPRMERPFRTARSPRLGIDMLLFIFFAKIELVGRGLRENSVLHVHLVTQTSVGACTVNASKL
jgi:hypothetical protein